jgi:hypothetical protein
MAGPYGRGNCSPHTGQEARELESQYPLSMACPQLPDFLSLSPTSWKFPLAPQTGDQAFNTQPLGDTKDLNYSTWKETDDNKHDPTASTHQGPRS